MIVAMSDDDQDGIVTVKRSRHTAIVKRSRTLHYGSKQEQEMTGEASGRCALPAVILHRANIGRWHQRQFTVELSNM